MESSSLYNGYEDLTKVIEKFTIQTPAGLAEFYYDTRFGTKIAENILHPAYKRCFNATVATVGKIFSIKRSETRFYLTISSEGKIVEICVSLYIDHSFICRDYDPTVIIPYILNSEERNYLKNKDHPFYRYGYIADYAWHPSINLILDPSTDLFDAGGKETKSECDSCISHVEEDCTLTKEDYEEIEREFSVGRLYEPNAIFEIQESNLEEPRIEESVERRIPKKPLKKLETHRMPHADHYVDVMPELYRMPEVSYIQEAKQTFDLNQKHNYIYDLNAAPETTQETAPDLPDWTVDMSLVPKLTDREDNI